MHKLRLEVGRFLIMGEVQPSTKNSKRVHHLFHYLNFLVIVGKALGRVLIKNRLPTCEISCRQLYI